MNMSKNYRDIGFFLLLMAAALVMVIVRQQLASEESVTQYLDNLGDKLFALVPEGNEKASLVGLYDQFLQSVAARQTSPEEIESVAATILNCTNSEDSLLARDAESLLLMAMAAPSLPAAKRAGQSAENIAPTYRTQPPGKQVYSRRSYQALQKKLNRILRLQVELQTATGAGAALVAANDSLLTIRYEQGLQVALDPKLKSVIERRRYARLADDIATMEREKMLVWQNNHLHQLQKRLAKLQINMNGMHSGMRRGDSSIVAYEMMLEMHTNRAGVDSLELRRGWRYLVHLPQMRSEERMIIESQGAAKRPKTEIKPKITP